MGTKVNLGGKRLGSGNKLQVRLNNNYSRSNSNISRMWRSSMACGTLVPCLMEIALPGDTHKIKIDSAVYTYPTIGPLFGSFKMQVDVFQYPFRLANYKLHNNMLDVGLEMDKIVFPQIVLKPYGNGGNNEKYYLYENGKVIDDWWKNIINPSSLLRYLGLKHIGTPVRNVSAFQREGFTQGIAYWDVYKIFYANKQEGIGKFIGVEERNVKVSRAWFYSNGKGGEITEVPIIDTQKTVDPLVGWKIRVESKSTDQYPDAIVDPKIVGFYIQNVNSSEMKFFTIEELAEEGTIVTNGSKNQLEFILGDSVKEFLQDFSPAGGTGYYGYKIRYTSQSSTRGVNNYQIIEFPLKNIDDTRNLILSMSTISPNENVTIDAPSVNINKNLIWEPYTTLASSVQEPVNVDGAWTTQYKMKSSYPQVGLALKTYQSDIFTNWLKEEWVNQVNNISKVAIIDNAFDINSLSFAKKLYRLANDTILADNSTAGYQVAAWGEEFYSAPESPIYIGGFSSEIVFNEVVSKSQAEDEPLGSIAGKGTLAGKKGGKIIYRCKEPSLILGIASITPRVDYYQGNSWITNIKDYGSLHKPAFDRIGFEDMLQEQAAGWAKTVTTGQGHIIHPSFGKTPAWINYKTSINEVFGDFAEENKAMFMTLVRRFEPELEDCIAPSREKPNSIKNASTYIEPQMFNYAFAKTSLDAQNFWVQIKFVYEVRRKMSASLIPNQ